MFVKATISITDYWVLSTALLSFTLFFILHVFIFRHVEEDEVIKMIINVFSLVTLLHIVIHTLFVSLYHAQVALLGWSAKGVCVALSFSIFALMSFLYILCIFGPNETSVRIRILKELYQAPGCTLRTGELLSRYNNRVVIRRRLERLLHSEELRYDGKSYSIKNRQSMFKVIDILATCLNRLMKGR